MTTTAAKIKVTRHARGHYHVSINGVKCFDVNRQWCDGRAWTNGYWMWRVGPMNPYNDWSHVEDRKKDAVACIKFLLEREGVEEIIDCYGEREYTWEGKMKWDEERGW